MIEDPRITQLMNSGMSPVMKGVLSLCGYELFMDLVFLVNEKSSFDGTSNMVYFPSPKTTSRIDRNGYICTLHFESGLRPKEIRKNLVKELGVSITERQVLRVIAQARCGDKPSA